MCKDQIKLLLFIPLTGIARCIIRATAVIRRIFFFNNHGDIAIGIGVFRAQKATTVVVDFIGHKIRGRPIGAVSSVVSGRIQSTASRAGEHQGADRRDGDFEIAGLGQAASNPQCFD